MEEGASRIVKEPQDELSSAETLAVHSWWTDGHVLVCTMFSFSIGCRKLEDENVYLVPSGKEDFPKLSSCL